jgi:hypothetical protein
MNHRPSNVVANQTEPRYLCISLHNPSQGTLRVLGHGIGFVEDNNFVWWARVCFAVRSDSLCTGCLTCKILDFLSDYRYAAFIGCV